MSGKQRAQFDFGRYGQILLGIALLLGIYLSRHAGSCVKESFSAYQLRGEASESSSGVIAGESGGVESSRSYYNGGGEGATGVFSFMMNATSYCTTTSSFRDPVFAYYGFLGTLGLGVLLLAAGRFIGPSWRKGVREQARTSQARKNSVDRPTDAADQRRPHATPPPGERYRVTGQHAAIGGAIEVDLQSSGGKMLEDMLEPTSLTEVRATGQHASLNPRSTGSNPAPRFEAPPVPAPPPSQPPSQPAARVPAAAPSPARSSGAHLEALGLGSVDDMLNESSGLGSAVELGGKPGGRSALDMIFAFGSVELPESSHVPGLSQQGDASGLDASGVAARAWTPVPAHSTPPPPLEDGFSLEMDGWEDEEEEELGHQEGIDFDALFAGGEERMEVPSGTPFPGSSLGEAALKAPVLGERMATSVLPLAAGYQSLIPAMETGMRRLYVAPLSAGGRGKGGGGSPHDPLIGLEPALARARSYAQRGERVEVRLLPGIYREHLKLPPNTLLVNDAVPLELGRPERLAWLASDAPHDTARHVVIALPTHAEPDEAALELQHASDSTLVGVHIAGRSLLGEEATTASGVGVRIEGSQRVTLRLCAIVGHTATEPGAGVQILQSGGSAEADVIFLEDCLIYQNTTLGRGGGLYAQGSSVHLDGCVIQDNLAHVAGGGLYLEDTRARTELSQCHIEGNRVECPGGLPATSSAGWGGEEGHGGGIFLRQGELSMRNVLLAANQAAGAGGGLYAASAIVTMEGEGQGARVTGNRALRGGGVLLCGFEDDEGVTALRASQVHFVNNSAEESGAGLALFRLVQLELRHCVLTRNITRATHSEGGAIHATVGARVRLEHTRIHQNAAGYRGGGLSICNSSLRIMDDCEVTGNRTLRGDSGGLAIYTMASSFVDVLKSHPRLELPFVCALAPCHIADNSATRGVGGLFVGSFDKASAYSIACVIKDAAMIKHNTVATDRPVRSPNLTLVWQGRVVGNDARPPVGRKTLD